MKKLLLLTLLALPARADFVQSLTSPGPLGKAHADLDSKCDKCHVPFKGIPNSSCLSCHAGTQKRISSGIGTHAQYEKQGKKCSSCHKDHKGRNHALSPPVEKDFDHATTGVILEGKHARAKCAGCHKNNQFGSPQWTNVPRECGRCHTDFHKGGLGPKCEARIHR